MKFISDLETYGYCYHRIRELLKESGVKLFKEKKQGHNNRLIAFSDEDFEKVQNIILENKKKGKNGWRKTKNNSIKEKSKKVECLKCHNTFVSEVDKMGVAYNRICPTCKITNKGVKNVLASVGRHTSRHGLNNNY